MKYVRGTKSIDPQTTVVICQGEMGTLAVEELHQAVDPLLSDTVSHLIFDLGAVEYVSSSVLSFLMATQNKAKAKGGKVSLVGARELVRQVFEMAALDSLFEFRGTLEELGIAQSTPALAKGKGKAARKEKVVPLTKAQAAAPAEAPDVSGQERSFVAGGKEKRGVGKEVEKIHPVQEQGSWKDYGVWIGIGVVVIVSVLASLYLYLVRS
jgi:anti-anti-sigma factor